tara:strand:+ start:464 stop:991 length:528 start_codon:yes stop_codon:yes gene_type:complete
MLLDKENIQRINDKKVTYVKKFAKITNTYDFNKISELADTYSEADGIKILNQTIGQVDIFYSIWQLKFVDRIDQFLFTFRDFFQKTFNYTPEARDGVDLFFSFISVIGKPHMDEEDIFLIGLMGRTIYRITDTQEDFELQSGDLLYVPKLTRHKALSMTPRVIASVGFRGGKNDC